MGEMVSENNGVAPVAVEAASGLTHDTEAGDLEAMTTPISKRSTPAFQFYPNDFLGSSKVQRMSLTERGAYITLLSHCWLDGGLSTDLKTLAAILHVKMVQFDRMWAGALHECFYEKNGLYQNRRLDIERKKQADFSKRQSDRANAGWDARRNAKGRNAVALQEPHIHSPQCSSSSSSSSSSKKPPTGAYARAPIIDQREHRNHAHCGRVCLHASLFGEFVRRRNHADADTEIRDWALSVEHEWGPGGRHEATETGDPFDFWRAQYDLKWPAPVTAKKSGVPAWAQ